MTVVSAARVYARRSQGVVRFVTLSDLTPVETSDIQGLSKGSLA